MIELVKNSAIAVALAVAICLSVAIAEEPPPPAADAVAPEGAPGDATAEDLDEPGRLIAYARKLRTDKGCAVAAPAYRVIAGMGEGQEAAQHELGECLLTMKGASETETALFRREGEFWLTRAAYAGNARAQRLLAMEMASPAKALHDPAGSLQWALVYAKNPEADLYGYGPLPATLVPGLRSSLAQGEIDASEAFAASFTPLTLAKFEPPKRDRKKRALAGDERQRPPGGRRRPQAAE